jgi:hypothetical protein
MAVTTHGYSGVKHGMPIRTRWLALLLVLAWPLASADDYTVIKLQQDVETLKQRVQELSRQVEDLKEQLTRANAQPGKNPRPGAATTASTTWVDAGNWKRVRAGMSELDVIGILGIPTSMRTDNTARVLLYATEIGSSGFLSGSVTVRDGQVTEVAQPVLK